MPEFLNMESIDVTFDTFQSFSGSILSMEVLYAKVDFIKVTFDTSHVLKGSNEVIELQLLNV